MTPGTLMLILVCPWGRRGVSTPDSDGQEARKPRIASYASHASELDGKDCQRKPSIHSILLSS
jgi:hypothetical protein